MNAIQKACITKRERFVRKAVYLAISELPQVIFLNSNLLDKRYRIFKKKIKTE